MEPTKYRCKLCSSEILAKPFGPLEAVCLLCRLSAEEARPMDDEAPRKAPSALRLLPRTPGHSALSAAS